MYKWKTKNEEKKEYKVTFGETDYNIPTFGYKSFIFIIIVLTLVVFIVQPYLEYLFGGIKWKALIISSILSSFAFTYSQFFIQSKKDLQNLFSLFLLVLVF
ncbi:hypothetical protein [Caviibacter abscessus]|uniref:hypothetical protein n=1 Tax=Caviibacter abscessus TaxID=1766719 RepID=UPI000834DC89|nr:hypothetical protein [Caviibacter abscessus]